MQMSTGGNETECLTQILGRRRLQAVDRGFTTTANEAVARNQQVLRADMTTLDAGVGGTALELRGDAVA